MPNSNIRTNLITEKDTNKSVEVSKLTPIGDADGAVIYVDTIADLMALDVSGIEDGQAVQVSEFRAGTDAGGGVFYWSSSKDKSSHNGGTIIDPEATFPDVWAEPQEMEAWFSAGVGHGCWVREHAEEVRAEWFGAVGDYSGWDEKGTDNWAAFQAALNTGYDVKYGFGKFRIHEKDLLFKTLGQRFEGSFSGSREFVVRDDFYPEAVDDSNSALVTTGTGERYIKTRIVYREFENDPEDDPISCLLNVQAPGVHLDRVLVLNDQNFDESVWPEDHTNIGADWDVAFFNGCRRNVRVTNCGVIGFYRKAGFYWDVTNLFNGWPFVSPTHGTLPENGYSNADQCYWHNIFAIHPLQSFVVRGPDPKDFMSHDYSNRYFDAQRGIDLTDNRGAAGMADFYGEKAFLWPWGHPSKRRIYDPVKPHNLDNEDLDAIPCSVRIEARGGNQGRVRKIGLNKIRAASFECAAFVFGRCASVQIRDVHTEPDPNLAGEIKDSSGNIIPNHTTVSINGEHYGHFAARSNDLVDRIFIDGCSTWNRQGPPAVFLDNLTKYGIGSIESPEDEPDKFVTAEFSKHLGLPNGWSLDATGSDNLRLTAPGNTFYYRFGSDDVMRVEPAVMFPVGDDFYSLGTNANRFQRVNTRSIRIGAGLALILSGAGSPEGAVSAAVGSIYTRTDGGAGTTLYIKESGAGSTGWAAK